ncbi:hypothetical protein N2W54_007453 [Lotmaria passim]
MSGSNNDDSRLEEHSGEEAPVSNVHPKLMTHRNSGSNPTSARQQTPHSARSDGAAAAVPTNAELAVAGVSAQDGVVQQLSARKQDSGSLAAPREVSGNSSGRRAPPTIAAGNGIGEPLQLSEARQRRESDGTPRSAPQPPQQHPQARHSPYASTSREPIRPGRRTSGHSPFRFPSKQNDPYNHVTSVVHEYLQSHINALEAQYKSVRSHSNAQVSQTRDPTENNSASSRQRDQPEAHTPRSTRQESPQPRHIAAEYLRGGVPRAALDAPHIKYAEALENMYNVRHSPRPARVYTPSASTVPSPNLPQVAQFIPDRFKYVEPSDEEKKRRKEHTLRVLQDWRERQKARNAGPSQDRGASPRQKNEQDQEQEPRASARKRTASKKSARTRSQQPLAERTAAVEKAAPAVVHGEEKPEWDNTFEPGFGTPQPSPRGRSKTPRSARTGRKSGAASRASSRKGRKSRGATPPATARSETTVNPNAFRRRLLFDITAPTLSVA